MVRLERENKAGEQLNRLEQEWWNSNADLVARVWQMPGDISSVVRSDYLLRARDFFLDGRTKSRVLELGCGSGWVGQSIASPLLGVIGTDFSKRQIELARENANLNDLNDTCRYIVADSKTWPDEFNHVDSVLIHAFLHHLDQQELNELLVTLRTHLSPGTRIWIYEPAFLTREQQAGSVIPGWTRGLLHLAFWLNKVADKQLKRLKLLDLVSLESFQVLQKDAELNGWYLSPKEIPLDQESFTKELENHFIVRGRRWATIYAIGWVFCISLVKNSALRWLLAQTLGRFYSIADRALARQTAYVDNLMKAPAHAFYVWECELKMRD